MRKKKDNVKYMKTADARYPTNLLNLHQNIMLTHISLASFCGTWAKSEKSDQTLQNAASDQVLHCLLTEVSFKNGIKMKNTTNNPKIGNRLVQLIRMGK